MLAYRHGLRASEVVNLRWSDVNLEHGTIYCRRAKGSRSTLWRLDLCMIKDVIIHNRQAKAGSIRAFRKSRDQPQLDPPKRPVLLRESFNPLASDVQMRPSIVIAVLTITIGIFPAISAAQDTPKPQTQSVNDLRTLAVPGDALTCFKFRILWRPHVGGT